MPLILTNTPSEDMDAEVQEEDVGTGSNDSMPMTGYHRKLPPTMNVAARTETVCMIGENKYEEIDISRIPYFASIGFKNGDSSHQLVKIVHIDIPLFGVALTGIESGCRQCFRLLSGDRSQFKILCDTYEFLQVDVCHGKTLVEVIEDLKNGQDTDGIPHKPQSRDAAFKLVYVILKDPFQRNAHDKITILNAVRFVVSNPIIFNWKTRHAVLSAYHDKILATKKQRMQLDRCYKLNSRTCPDIDEDEVTTENDSS